MSDLARLTASRRATAPGLMREKVRVRLLRAKRFTPAESVTQGRHTLRGGGPTTFLLKRPLRCCVPVRRDDHITRGQCCQLSTKRVTSGSIREFGAFVVAEREMTPRGREAAGGELSSRLEGESARDAHGAPDSSPRLAQPTRQAFRP